MRKLLTLLFVVVTVCAYSRQITSDEAEAVAFEFFNPGSSKNPLAKKLNIRRVKAKEDVTDSDVKPYYVFNGDNNSGFVIISGDDRAQRILGYSDKGNFDFNNLPPQLEAMLEQYAEQIHALPASTAPDPSWSTPAKAPDSSEGVLLETANWGQGYPYNTLTPEIDGQHCPTGCVATAMAIVMKYHNWPPRTYGKEVTNFYHNDIAIDYNNNEIDWEKLDEPSETFVKEVSKLMLLTGTSVHTHYEKSGSGSPMHQISHELIVKFGYNSNCSYLTRKFYEDEEWKSIIDEQLSKGLPIIYGSTINNSREGHTYVLDGKEDNLYHINWGWSGICNGYFDLDFLKPTNDNYSGHQSMCINIKPDLDPQPQLYSPLNVVYGWNTTFRTGKINSNTKEIRRNELVTFTGPVLSFPLFNGLINYALLDENDNIVEFATPYFAAINRHRESENVAMTSTEFLPYMENGWRLNNNIQSLPVEAYSLSNFCQCFAFTETDILPNHRVVLMSKEDSENEWKQILGLNGMLNYVPVTEISSLWADIKWDFNSDYLDIKQLNPHIVGESLTHILRYQDSKEFNLIYKSGNSNVFINNTLIDNLDFSDDFLGAFYETIPNEYPRLMFPSDQYDYHIKIEYTPDPEIGCVATSIRFSQENVKMKVDETLSLIPEFTPKATTNKSLNWSSSNESVATIDSNGLVSAITPGESIVTATATDNSGVSATCVVTVSEPIPGDSNGNGAVNVADAVNTANYVVGNDVKVFYFTAADVNNDNRITFADASGTITIILDELALLVSAEIQSLCHNDVETNDVMVIENYSASSGQTGIIGITLDNLSEYVALQADITLPNGMILENITAGKMVSSTHSLWVKQLDSNTYRVVLFDHKNTVLENSNEHLFELAVKVNQNNIGDIIVNNIIAADSKAQEFYLTSVGGVNDGVSGLRNIENREVIIEIDTNGVIISNLKGEDIIVNTIEGLTIANFAAKTDIVEYPLAKGFYLITVGSKTTKIILK